MWISEIITDLQRIKDAKGDLEVTISVARQDIEQKYLVAHAMFVVLEEYADDEPDNVMIRDWPY